LSMAEQIEAVRVPEDQEIIFSHRLRPTSAPPKTPTDNESLFDREGWSKFQEKSRELADESQYVVAVDIADFYSRVYHHRLENQLKYLEPGGGRTRHIMQMLGAFSGNVSCGLPIGGPAARILSELLLSPTDRLIQTQLSHVRFVRYADDFVSSRPVSRKPTALWDIYLKSCNETKACPSSGTRRESLRRRSLFQPYALKIRDLAVQLSFLACTCITTLLANGRAGLRAPAGPA
jgi:hypothetical protein